jgi:hypothetical protein
MSKKSHSPGPVPRGNRPQSGTTYTEPDQDETNNSENNQTGQEQDVKRRLGNFTGKGEHARQQPGPLNDGGERHGEDAG